LKDNFFHYNKNFSLESGELLPEFTLAYQTWGKLNQNADNVIWVCHALTGGADIPAWWTDMLGKGKLLDTEKYFIVCANMLGSCYGSTHALSINPLTTTPYYHEFPLLTNRDMMRSFDLLREFLKIEKIYLLTGGSMGGQQALEWAIEKPHLFENLFLAAANAQHSPWGIAFNEAQRMAIQADSTWKENHPEAGLKGMQAARATALLSYRNYKAYLNRQKEKTNEKLDDFRASSYQNYQGEKLAKRFDAFTYWTLSKAMDSHNIARDRESITKALQKVKANTLVMGICTDELFPVEEQKLIAQGIKNAVYEEINSPFGHDGFLIESDIITMIVRDFLEKSNKKLQRKFPLTS